MANVPYQATPRFERAFRRKQRRNRRLALAILEAMERVVREPDNRGLNIHPIQGAPGVWEARVDRANRITFELDGETIVFRNNCSHDIIDHRQW